MNVDADDVDIKLHEIASMIEFALRAFGEEDNYENRNLVDFALRSRPASDCSSRQHLAQGKGERP